MNPSQSSSFDLESLSRADLIQIVEQALSAPDGFPLWLRRKLSSREGTSSFEQEISSQIQEVFGDFDNDTDATDLINSIREAVACGKASADQGAVWALDALIAADEAIANHEDCEFQCSCDLDDLEELALGFLAKAAVSGKELAQSLLALQGLEHTGRPRLDLTVFAKRLGKDGLQLLRSTIEQNSYPDTSILNQIYELQQDSEAWISLKLESSNADDQIAALERIKATHSAHQAIERAANHLKRQEASGREALKVREWWYRELAAAGTSLEKISQDAWATFQRNAYLHDAWALLQAWAQKADAWPALRSAALQLLEQKEKGTYREAARHTRIRIARSEGRFRDAWEIARLGLPRRHMLEAIRLAAAQWPDEAQAEFDRIVESAFRGLERTNAQGIYQEFANLLSQGKGLFGKEWLAPWSQQVGSKFAKRPKLLQMVAKA